MIGFLALALAADAESKANNANRNAQEAGELAQRRAGLDSAFIKVSDFNIVNKPERESTGFFDSLTVGTKKVLADKPCNTYSVRRSDITRIEQRYDGDSKPYVNLYLAKYARIPLGNDMVLTAFSVPGTVEEAMQILNGATK